MTDYVNVKSELRKIIKGEIFDDEETLRKYSRDASLFEVWPKLVIWPEDSGDIQKIVRFVSETKEKDPVEYQDLSVTVRAAGSCMSGGSLNESIILDVMPHFKKLSVDPVTQTAEVEPGVFYRDFEPETLKQKLILPCYTASKNLCAIGGMIGNNAAGEKTLQYGKMENFIEELSVVLKDGNEYTFKAVPRVDLLRKSHEHSFEGEVYSRLSNLLDHNREIVMNAKPHVSKNSAGYYLWNIEKNGMFDLCKLIVGSQGTLGIVTRAKLKLVPIKSKSKLLVIFMNSIDKLGDLVKTILPHNPESLESYDDDTLKLAIRFWPEMLSLMKTDFFKLMFSFLPEFGMILTSGFPKLVLMVEFSSDDDAEIDKKIEDLRKDLAGFPFKMRATKTAAEAQKYWTVRRESFNLLRKHVRGKRTAPFIDDICIDPSQLPDFLPRLRKILDDAKLEYTIAGHAGNGNFHIIPLMNMSDAHNRALITQLSDKVYDLLKEYHGSITAEHNDGIVRSPYLGKMYSPEVLKLFEETKKIFDPQNIFNPHKKVGATVEYLVGHLAKN